jgi:hypothetical protein
MEILATSFNPTCTDISETKKWTGGGGRKGSIRLSCDASPVLVVILQFQFIVQASTFRFLYSEMSFSVPSMLRQTTCRIVLDTEDTSGIVVRNIHHTADGDKTNISSENFKEVIGSDILDEVPTDKLEQLHSDNQGDHDVPATIQDKLSLWLPSVRTRCRSPATVQEWVAALPDTQEVGEEGENRERNGDAEHDTDNLTLGAEGMLN